MRVMKFISVAVGLAMLLTLAIAQQAATAPSTPTVKHVPINRAPVNSGKDMFNSYCAVCHGTDAKGAGPAASAMKTNPVDLTALAKKSGGKYPASHVAAVLRGQAITASMAVRICQFGDHCSPALAKGMRRRCSNGLQIWLTTSELCKQSKCQIKALGVRLRVPGLGT